MNIYLLYYISKKNFVNNMCIPSKYTFLFETLLLLCEDTVIVKIITNVNK